jgi:glycosyltransferase AglI
MKEQPFVSIIVPVYNGELCIAACIESLLKQDYPSDRYEVIIVDNDSSDRTPEIIKSYSVRYVLEIDTHTSYGARNAGARAAQGELLAFCDADQIGEPDWLTQLVPLLADDCAGVAGAIHFHGEGLSMVSQFAGLETKNDRTRFEEAAESTDQCGTGNVLYRKNLFDHLGGFNPKAISGGDFEFSTRVVRDLGMRIPYTPKAIQYHKHRTTLKGLLKREARVGFGSAWYHKTHDLPRKSITMEALRVAGRTAHALCATAKAVLLSPIRQKTGEKICMIWLGVFVRIMNFYGRVVFRFGASIPRNW